MTTSDAQPDTLLALLRGVGDGDGHAFRALHAISVRRLLPFALRIVKSRALAEEVLQESFIAIWRDAFRYDCTRAAPITWMITIVRNKAIDCVRANALRERLTDDAPVEAPCGLADPAAGPCDLVELGQRRRLIDDGLMQLALHPRRAIELAFFDELTHGEVAARMAIPLGTAKTWIRRGCRQIRSHMEGRSERAAAGSLQGRARG